jgi:predicted RNA-binding protein with PIN domain
MQTTLVVDGYNAINAIPKAGKELAKSLEAARNAIIAISKEYARSSGYITDVRVVFDGDDQYRHFDGMNIPGVTFHIFSRTGKGDDKVI